MKRWMIVLIIMLMVGVAGVYAYTLTENTTTIIKYQGQKPITDMINSGDPNATAGILTSESDKVLKFVTFPYQLPGTNITVIKYRCNFQKQYCGFWINATRNGQSVSTNSPVWITPPPYLIIVSENYDNRKDILTITVKEDPLESTTRVLKVYVDQCPLGEPVIGTPE